MHHRRSPLVQGGLEILVKVTVRMETSTENSQAMERFKELVHHYFKELVNGQLILMTVQKKCNLNSQMRAVMKRTPHN
mgnify:CR=1 FL=1